MRIGVVPDTVCERCNNLRLGEAPGALVASR
jgi:hypothetical protein